MSKFEDIPEAVEIKAELDLLRNFRKGMHRSCITLAIIKLILSILLAQSINSI